MQQLSQYQQANQYAELEPVAREVIAIAEEAGISRALAVATGSLGMALFQLGHPAEAEALFRRAIPLREAEFGPTHRNVLTLKSLLGMAMTQQGRLSEGAAQLADAVKLEATYSPRGAIEITRSRMQYGLALSIAGQVPASEEQFRLAMENGAGAGDPSHLRVLANVGVNYAKSLILAKKFALAIDAGRKAVALTEAQYGADNAWSVRAREGLAQALLAQDNHQEAALVLRGLAPRAEKVLGPRNFSTANIHFMTGLIAESAGQADQADVALKRAAELMRTSGSSSQQLNTAIRYAKYLVRQKRDADALEQYKFALDIIDRLFAETRGFDEQSRDAFATRYAPVFYETINLLVRMHRETPGAGFDRQAFSITARTQSRLFSEMLRQADVKSVAGDLEFQNRTRERDALIAKLSRTRGVRAARARVDDADLAGSDANETSGLRARTARLSSSGAVAEAQKEVSKLELAVKSVDERLTRDYPRYMELMQPRPVEVADVQKQLRPGEALLSYFVTPGNTPIFLVTPDQFFMRPAGMTRTEIADLVWKARNPSEAVGGSLASLAALDPNVLLRLYEGLVRPVESFLRPGQKIIVVADGPLYTLPMEMLITAYGPAERQRFTTTRSASKDPLSEYATLPYLGDKYRFSYLPSLTALVSQRQFSKPRIAFDRELMSFADPVFAGNARTSGSNDTTRAIQAYSGASNRSGGSSLLARLPETADEAAGIAAVLGGKSSIFLRENAQERTAKTADMRATRVVHFATHGLLSSEFLQVKQSLDDEHEELLKTAAQGTQRNLSIAKAAMAAIEDEAQSAETAPAAKPEVVASLGSQATLAGGRKILAQPALALTMAGNTQGEDGLLTMSEVIENLNLNADVVVLSACNTAGETANTSTGEGFAGLTRAFMFAGARSMLVSHWSVDSLSTTMLITSAFGILKSGQALDESLAQARAKVRASSGPGYSRAHPFFWAPFVQIGDY